MGISEWFKPRWKHSDPCKRLDAIGKIQSAPKLAKIYTVSDDWCVKQQIAIKLRNEEMIREVATKNRSIFFDSSLFDAVTQYVQNRDLLDSIARQASSYHVRSAAAIKLQDRALILDLIHSLAATGTNYEAALNYLKKQKDTKALKEIIAGSATVRLMVQAFEALPNEEIDASILVEVSARLNKTSLRELSGFGRKIEVKVNSAGWKTGFNNSTCSLCDGKGSIKEGGRYHYLDNCSEDPFEVTCPECRGEGLLYFVIFKKDSKEVPFPAIRSED
jgi:hypothetical protein